MLPTSMKFLQSPMGIREVGLRKNSVLWKEKKTLNRVANIFVCHNLS